jgi:hypothetical protein
MKIKHVRERFLRKRFSFNGKEEVEILSELGQLHLRRKIIQ